jgi:ABC-type lipoprotein release transport system permease subunit
MLVVPAKTDLSRFYELEFDGASMPDSYPATIRSSRVSQDIGYIQTRLYGNVDVDGTSVIVVGEKTSQRNRFFAPASSGKAILGKEAAKRLELGPGDSLGIRDLSLTVAEVTNSPPDGLDMAVFTSLETAQEVLGRPGAINSMRMGGCWCRLDIPALASKVEGLLDGTRAITVAGVLKAQTGSLAVVKRYSVVAYAVAILLIAGIVIILVSSQVRRQKREIGLLLAIGAPTGLIKVFFVIMAGIMGTIGGALGYVLGSSFGDYAASRIVDMPVSAPPYLLGLVLAFSLLVSMASAYYPARRAANLDPTEILRES